MVGYGDRVYQKAAEDAAFDHLAEGYPSVLMVMPTGTGKTIVSARCIGRFVAERKRRVLFLANRKKLVAQAFDRFTEFGLSASIEMAGHDGLAADAMFGKSDVVCASVQSLQGDRLARWKRGEFGLVIADEAHHALSGTWEETLGYFTDYQLIGITATPDRGDQRNLGCLFGAKCFDYPIRHAIAGDGKDDPGGWLVPPVRRVCPTRVDLRGVRCKGDFNIGDLEERIGPMVEVLARDVVREVGDRPTVIFTPDVGSAQAMADVLRLLGMKAEYVAGAGGRFGMPAAESDEILRKFEAGEVQTLVNCELLVEGWDCPRVKCVVVCRPTAKRYRYAQMVGRGLRPYGDWADCLVVDFDWETDSEARDLALSVDLFDDGSLPEDVIGIAREIERKARQSAEPADPQKIVEEAEEVYRIRSRLQIRLTGACETYRSYEMDPIGVGKVLDLGVTKHRDYDRRGNNPATDKQLGFLRSLGVERPEGLSMFGASRMIDRLMKRKKQGAAGVKAVRTLLASGVDPGIARGLSAEAARVSIAEIDKVNRIMEHQGRLFET